MHDKAFIFVGQGTDKSTYKNALNAKPYKAYGVLIRYAVRLTTSNKKGGFVMLRPAKFWLDSKSDQVIFFALQGTCKKCHLCQSQQGIQRFNNFDSV